MMNSDRRGSVDSEATTPVNDLALIPSAASGASSAAYPLVTALEGCASVRGF